MKFQCVDATATTVSEVWNGDTLAIGLFPLDEDPAKDLAQSLLGPGMSDLLERRQFKGEPGDILVIERLSQTPTTLVLVGLGDTGSHDAANLRKACARAAMAAHRAGTRKLGLWMPRGELDPTRAAAAMAEACRLATYSDQRFRSEPDQPASPELVALLGLPSSASEGLERLDAICGGVELARQLVAAPPNVATPQHLADTAASMAGELGLEYKLLERSDCEALGMGAFLGVSQGSDLAPKFIHLIYRPSGPVNRRVVLVGKGLTFDSGGYNLKVGASQIEMMKYDMGGSAAVLGAAHAIARCRPEGVETHILVASCENMISGGAIHPGDILTASNGKTIEINNTDAEGRLTLADALVYACELKPDAIVDLATLTGACVIALGNEIAGLWCSTDELADGLLAAGQEGGESLWRMPLRSSYKVGLKSQLADLKNTGPRPGGSITAALFLRDFVSKTIPWAHIDIAGTVWKDKGQGENPAGATGFGVRTLVNWICAGAPA